MQFQITLPQLNVGREDRLIRAVLAACLLTMSAFGLVSTRHITLVSLLFGISGAYCAWTAATARCFAYERLAIDTRSESEAAAHLAQLQARATELAAGAEAAEPQGDLAPQPARLVIRIGESSKPAAPVDKPAAPVNPWGHSLLGGK
jgi:hypothetical protein